MAESGNTEQLTIEISSDGAILVSGEIDMVGGPLVETAASDRASDAPIVIDVGGVSFIDSSGLRSLLAIARRAHERNATVLLRTVGPEVARLLEITGTGRLFEIEARA